MPNSLSWKRAAKRWRRSFRRERETRWREREVLRRAGVSVHLGYAAFGDDRDRVRVTILVPSTENPDAE
jgi:hypothetical protein